MNPDLGRGISQDSIEPEQKNAIGSSAVELATHITNKWPQVFGSDSDQRLGYVFTGSFSAVLLSQTRFFNEIDSDRLPHIFGLDKTAISQQAYDALGKFVRPIGDIDIIVDASYNHGSGRITRNTKIPHNQIPTNAKACIDPRFQSELNIDIIKDRADINKVIKISPSGHELFLVRPDELLGQKLHQIIAIYHGKKEQYDRDFPLLLNAAKAIYPYTQILQTVHELFRKNDERALLDKPVEMPMISLRKHLTTKEYLLTFLSQQEIPEDISQFLGDLAEYDQKQPNLLFT